LTAVRDRAVRDEKKDGEKPRRRTRTASPSPSSSKRRSSPSGSARTRARRAAARDPRPEHWLSSRTDGEIHAIVESRRVFTPLKLDKGANVGVYAKKDRVVASGLVWDDVRDLLAQKAFLMHQPLAKAT